MSGTRRSLVSQDGEIVRRSQSCTGGGRRRPPLRAGTILLPPVFARAEAAATMILSGKFPSWTMRLFAVALAIIAAVSLLLSPRAAVPAQESEILLTVTGRIEHRAASGGGVQFDREALERLPQHEITTSTPWTDGVSTYEGPLLCDLLSRLGAEGKVLHARALNDYIVEVPVEDCERYPVILALKRDGQELSRRNKGPVWIVYPRDDFPELQLETVDARWVWQLIELEVR